MSSIRMTREGVVHTRNLILIREHTQRGMRQALFAIGKDYLATANQNILHEEKRGRLYLVRGPSGRTRRHRASAPGQSHANLTGKLRRSMGWKVRGATQLEFGYGVTEETTLYAKTIERGGGRIKPRPTLIISITQNRRNTMNHIERLARRGLGV